MIVIDPLVPLLNAHRVAVRPARVIEPGSLIKSGPLGDKRVVVLPLTDGITPPARLFNVLREIAAVGPDGAPLLVKQVQDDDVFRSLYDPARPEVMKNDAREALRITTGYRIICQRGGDLRDAKRRFVGQKRFASRWGERQFMFWLPVRRHLLSAVGVDT